MGTTGLTPAGWYADPTGRHVYRWWDGSGWTDRVGDGAQEFLDPFGHELHPVPTTAAPAWSGPAWAPPVEPVGAEAPTGRRWGWIIGGLVAAGLVVVAVVAVGVFVLVRSTTGPIIDEHFGDGAGRFSTDSDNFVDLDAVDGVYRVTLKDVSSPQEARSFFDPARSAINVSATAAVTEAPAAAAAGVSCYSSSDTGYVFVVTSDGKWALLKVTGLTQGNREVLAQGSGETRISADAITLHLGCTGGGKDPTVVTGQVDDGAVHTADDADGYDQFRAAGFFAAAEEAPSTITFDDMVVKDAS